MYSGIQYENNKKGREEERIVNAIMREEIGNLEWIVAHFVAEMDNEQKQEYLKELKSKKIKR